MAVGDEEKGYGSVEPSAATPRAEPSAEAERSTRREARLHVAGVTTVVLICSALIFLLASWVRRFQRSRVQALESQVKEMKVQAAWKRGLRGSILTARKEHGAIAKVNAAKANAHRTRSRRRRASAEFVKMSTRFASFCRGRCSRITRRMSRASAV